MSRWRSTGFMTIGRGRWRRRKRRISRSGSWSAAFLPRPPGRTLDEQVMRPDASLADLERKFVCVRLIQANRLDLSIFQYDYDLSWTAMFLNADLAIYGRYGSRSGGTRNQADGLLSLAA